MSSIRFIQECAQERSGLKKMRICTGSGQKLCLCSSNALWTMILCTVFPFYLRSESSHSWLLLFLTFDFYSLLLFLLFLLLKGKFLCGNFYWKVWIQLLGNSRKNGWDGLTCQINPRAPLLRSHVGIDRSTQKISDIITLFKF